jgi:DNA-binding NarL/FixJ family response regulator
VARLLLVDDAASLAHLFAAEVERTRGHSVHVVCELAAVPSALEAGPFDLAIVDLSFPKERATGLDALATVHRAHPSTLLAILTQGDQWVAETLRDAWELLPIATVLSKSAPLDEQLTTIERVLATGSAPPDPAIQPLLPSGGSGRRSHTDFGKLVHHQGHAKLWAALLASGNELSYRSLARTTGLKLNTIKNYRAQLLPELASHGMGDASLQEMQAFAVRCRAFLQPHLGDAGNPEAT